METKRIALPSSLETRDETLVKDGLLSNCYSEQGPVEKCVVKRPGLEILGTLPGECVGQGAYYFVDGPVYVKCDTLHTETEIPPPPDPTEPLCPGNWVTSSVYQNFDWQWCAWNGSVYCNVVHNQRHSRTSPDGLTWTYAPGPPVGPPGTPGMPYTALGRVVWDGTVFCTHGPISIDTWATMQSTDGLVWDATLIVMHAGWGTMAVSDGTICIVETNLEFPHAVNSTLASINHGNTWSVGTLPIAGTWMALGGALGTRGFAAAAYNSNKCGFSITGVGWGLGAMPVVAKWSAIGHNGEYFVAVSDDGYSATSVVGDFWELGGPVPDVQFATNYAQMIWVPEAGRFFCSTMRSNVIITSTDGITWELLSAACGFVPSGHWLGIASNGSELVIVGGDFPQAAVGQLA